MQRKPFATMAPVPASSRHLPVLGITLKLASVVVFAGMLVCIKYLGRDIPAGQTIFVRGLISVVVLALLAWSTGRLHLLKTDNWRSHALRSLCGTVSMFCLFVAIAMIPLADLTAISFTTPLFLTVLAMVFLGERIHGFRWTALGIGFVGVLVTIGPHLSFTHGASAGVLVALSSAIFSAFALMFLRKMSGGEHAITITFYFSLTFMVCSALTAIRGWPMPTPAQWLLIVRRGIVRGVRPGADDLLLQVCRSVHDRADRLQQHDHVHRARISVLRRNSDAVGLDRRAADSRRRPDHPVARVLLEKAAERAELAILRDCSRPVIYLTPWGY